MTKAKRATLNLGDRALEVFQLNDGAYQLSQAQVAKAVNKPRRNASVFLQSKWLKSLSGIDYMRPENPPGIVSCAAQPPAMFLVTKVIAV